MAIIIGSVAKGQAMVETLDFAGETLFLCMDSIMNCA